MRSSYGIASRVGRNWSRRAGIGLPRNSKPVAPKPSEDRPTQVRRSGPAPVSTGGTEFRYAFGFHCPSNCQHHETPAPALKRESPTRGGPQRRRPQLLAAKSSRKSPEAGRGYPVHRRSRSAAAKRPDVPRLARVETLPFKCANSSKGKNFLWSISAWRRQALLHRLRP